uniref:Secreted protein n=1 Tax=Cacopsylla melanoneura TaxID=428564 RepID=A0A8D9A3L5_9HEMI
MLNTLLAILMLLSPHNSHSSFSQTTSSPSSTQGVILHPSPIYFLTQRHIHAQHSPRHLTNFHLTTLTHLSHTPLSHPVQLKVIDSTLRYTTQYCACATQ